ncbi:MAG: flagellin lysine-N-methylase [Oscillospiraceae bacterium]|nr:flagellin lysine-N-methylase [Oscillospiraceae bacterium]
MTYYFKQPRYFNEFKCIGGACPETCCAKWSIIWTNAEIDKVLAVCSPELKAKMKTSFEDINGNNKKVKLNNRECPFLTEDRLCSIQKELGEEYLSYTCGSYPRLVTQFDNVFVRSCDSTCIKVLQLVCEKENSIDMVLQQVKQDNVKAKQVNKDNLHLYPTLEYYGQIFNFFYDILYNRKRSIEDSIILGALAAKKISDFEEDNKHNMLGEVIEKLKQQINSDSQVRTVEQIKSNPTFSFGVINEIVKKLWKNDIFQVIYTDGAPDIDKINIGREKFNKHFSDKPYILKNIIINNYIQHFTFKYNGKMSVYENYMFFAVTACIIRFAAYVAGYASNELDVDLYHYLSLVHRELYNNSEHRSIALDYLKEHNWTSPAYIASMIK